MGKEIDLLKNYPKSKRDLESRSESKTDENREIARKFDYEFFDGDRKNGYGGFNYHSRFWDKVIPDFIDHWKLDKNSSVLDVGCAKGFMLYDLKRYIPEIKISGIDISKYAINNSIKEIKPFLIEGDAKKLPFENNSFDVVISINTIHNLDLEKCKKAIKEIDRVSIKGSFITVDAYNNNFEKKRMYDWNLTAKTIMSVDEWKKVFKELDYKGDYYWFIP